MSARFTIAALLVVTALLSVQTARAQGQTGRTFTRADFFNIEGGSLNDRIDRAVRQFRDSRQGELCWVAWHFPARDGASIGPFSDYQYHDSDGIRLSYKSSPAGAAVFLLAETSGNRTAFTRVKLLNISEPYIFEDRPVYWLGDADATQSLAQIEAVMRSDGENKTLARSALKAVSAHNSTRVVPMLRDAAVKDQSFDLQRAAISGLSHVGTKESLDALDELFGTIRNVALRQEIVRAYAATGNRTSEKRVFDRLTAIARSDDDLVVRREAIRRIASFRGDAVTERLFEIYDGNSHPEIKREILRRVSAERNERATRRLMAVARNDQDADMQREAVRRIAAARSEESVGALIELYDALKVERVKEEIIGLLGSSNSRRASDKLMAIARDDLSPNLRQKAIRRLASGHTQNLSLR